MPIQYTKNKLDWTPEDIWKNSFFPRFGLYKMLEIVPSCNLVQYQGKLIMQHWENSEKPNFGSRKIVFVNFISTSRQTLFQANILCNLRKLMEQTWNNGEKPNFGPDFGSFSPNLGSQFFFVGFSSTRY